MAWERYKAVAHICAAFALIFNESGEMISASLTPEKFQALGKVQVLGGHVWAHPAYADRCIFARTDEEIVCVPLVK